MTKAFISYSRKDTIFTRKLADALLAEKYELWVDWESIPPTVDWKLHIQKGVEDSDTFLFLISPDSIKSHECAEELKQAVKNGKRLIPLVVREINAEDAPNELKHINWIYFLDSEAFHKSFKKLIEAINTDYEWVMVHSRLQTKALEWDRAVRENSFLLRGKDLEYAEGQLVINASKNPQPTNLQRDFILNSRKVAARQRRNTMVFLMGAAVVMFILMVAAIYQGQVARANAERAVTAENLARKNEQVAKANAKQAEENAVEARNNATIAQIGEVASLAVGRINQDYNESLLYSIEAYHRAQKTQFNLGRAESALLTTLQSQRGLVQVLPAHSDWINSVAYSGDGTVMATAAWDGTSYLWDSTNPLNPTKVYQLDGDDIAISLDKKLVAAADVDEEFNPVIKIWNISTLSKPIQLGQFPGNYIIDFLPDAKSIVTQFSDENNNYFLQIWNIANASKPVLLSTIPGVNATINSNGTLMAASTIGEENTTITLWNIASPAVPTKFTFISGSFDSYNNLDIRQTFAFSPDSQILAIAGYDASHNTIVKLWNVSNPYSLSEISTMSGNSDQVNSLAFSPNGQELAMGNNDGKILLWNISDPGKPFSKPSTDTLSGHSLAVNDMAFSTDGSILTTASYDGTIMLWDMQGLNNPLQVRPPYGESLSVSMDGKLLVSGYYDADREKDTTVLWDVSKDTNPVQLAILDYYSYYAAISSDNKLLATSSWDAQTQSDLLILWDITDPVNPVQYKILDKYVDTLSFTPDLSILSASYYDDASGDESTTIWDVSNPQKPVVFANKPGYATLATSSDDKVLSIVSTEATIEFWDISKPGSFIKLGNVTGNGVTFNPTQKQVAILKNNNSDNPDLELWDITSWKNRSKLSEVEGSLPIFSPDGKLLALVNREVSDNSYTIYLWNLSDAKNPVSSKLKGHTREISSLAFSSDGKTLASASFDKAVILWDISNPASPKKGVTLTGHSDWIRVLQFSPDGKLLASGGDDHNIILWHTEAYNKAIQLGSLRGQFSDYINNIRFASQTRLISNSLKIWDLDPNSWIEKACDIAGSNFTQEKWAQLFPDEPYHQTCENIAPESLASAEPGEIVPVNIDSNLLPVCTEFDTAETGCSLLAVEERDRFCVGKTSYTLYAVPEGSTLTPLNNDYKCNDEGIYNGDQLYSCYGPPMNTFPAQVCNTGCATPQSDQCAEGFGVDSTGSCCVPISADLTTSGCVQVTLEIKSCTAQ
jgi:WD40 repeat protein